MLSKLVRGRSSTSTLRVGDSQYFQTHAAPAEDKDGEVAYLIVAGAVSWMVATENPTFMLMILLLCGFGLRHPPSSDDSVPIGKFRTMLAWLTLAFVPIGFTPVPFMTIEPVEAPAIAPEQTPKAADNSPSIIPMQPLVSSKQPG